MKKTDWKWKKYGSRRRRSDRTKNICDKLTNNETVLEENCKTRWMNNDRRVAQRKKTMIEYVCTKWKNTPLPQNKTRKM